MEVGSKLLAAIRGAKNGLFQPVEASPDGELLVASALPPYAEITRQGDGWAAMSTAAVAALVVRPGVTAMATLWNGEGEGGKSYIIDRAFAHNLVGTANSVYGIWLCAHKRMAAVTNDITARGSLSGKGTGYGGAARFDIEATVVDDGWFPYGLSEHTVTVTTPGGQVEALVAGRIIVPPQCGVSLQIVANVVGVTFTSGFAWYERKLTVSV